MSNKSYRLDLMIKNLGGVTSVYKHQMVTIEKFNFDLS